MKTKLILLYVLATLLVSFNQVQTINAQSQQVKHLEFMGFQVNGSLNSFVGKLQTRGFRVSYNFDTGCSMVGPYLGYSDCEIYIIITPRTKTVWKIYAVIGGYTSWSFLRDEFNNIKYMITQKYGEPHHYINWFGYPYNDGDGYELTAIKSGRSTFEALWYVPNGIIWLEINDDCSIAINYQDDINSELHTKEIMRDL